MRADSCFFASSQYGFLFDMKLSPCVQSAPSPRNATLRGTPSPVGTALLHATVFLGNPLRASNKRRPLRGRGPAVERERSEAERPREKGLADEFGQLIYERGRVKAMTQPLFNFAANITALSGCFFCKIPLTNCSAYGIIQAVQIIQIIQKR